MSGSAKAASRPARRTTLRRRVVALRPRPNQCSLQASGSLTRAVVGVHLASHRSRAGVANAVEPPSLRCDAELSHRFAFATKASEKDATQVRKHCFVPVLRKPRCQKVERDVLVILPS